MFSGNDFPKYLRSTPIIMEKDHPFALMEPNSGNQILPEQYNTVLSPRQRKVISDLQTSIRGCDTYGQLIDVLDKLRTDKPDAIGEVLHRLLEDEDGNFNLGMQLVLVGAKEDFEIFLATAFKVKFDPELFQDIYLDEESQEVDDLTMLSVTATNAMTMLVQNCDIENPLVIMGIEAQLSVHDVINEQRWAGVKCELLGGIPAVIVMRRWGLLNSTTIVEHGVDENAIFSDLVESLLEGK